MALAEVQSARPTREPTSGLERVLRVIYAVSAAGADGIGVSALAREVDQPKAVTHRLLKGLVAGGFLAFDNSTKCYRLGTGALAVGLAALRQTNVQQTARPVLERLVRETRETATLSLKQGDSRIYVDQVLSPQEIRMSVATGVPYPLHAGSSSKAILAAMSDAAIDEYLASHDLNVLTPATIASRHQLLEEIVQIRERGYAFSAGERDAGAASVAAAVLGMDGVVLGSISVCGPVGRFEAADIERLGVLVRSGADETSRAIGHLPG
ncbi:IclR family transcriptional regulator [Micromonospora globbae]|uniref:IclR family transcriptional regulator n=2 Tax=Micromonospora globbae TaxID=1894969 RepID=A0ABZ1SCK7_9ACTN|nr:IclR family transcriptional regulator [Micromonospora globbae]